MNSKAAMLAAAVALVAATGAGAQSGPSAGWTPTQEMVAKLEARVQAPPGAGDFHDVNRYYWGRLQDGHRMLIGQYHMRERPGRIFIVPTDGPGRIVRDGGCSFVNVFYDVDADTIVSVRCEGLA